MSLSTAQRDGGSGGERFFEKQPVSGPEIRAYVAALARLIVGHDCVHVIER